MFEMYGDNIGIANPYAVAPAAGMSMSDERRHDSGNALAANSEARAVAEVKAQVIMSRQYPRDPALSAERILAECQRPTLADAAVYSYTRGKEVVTGPSIRLAEVLARNWGNNTFGYEVLERKMNRNGVGMSVIRAYAWDLETNTYIVRQFEVKHWRDTKSGGYPITADRDIYELEANMAARRVRACILQMVPGDITTAAVNACRYTESSGLSEKMKDKNERAKLINGTIKVYEGYGATRADLENLLKAPVEGWTADHMLRLKEIRNAIKDNAASVADYFPHLAGNEKNDTVSKDQIKKLMEAAQKTGCQGDISNALKQMGIAKYADVPVVKYDEVMNMILGYGEKAAPDKLGSDDLLPVSNP